MEGLPRRMTARENRDAILDAARSCVLDFGVRRTTLAEIARRAGVSRMTIYRRYPDVGAVVRELMTRDFVSMLERIVASAADGDAASENAARTSADSADGGTFDARRRLVIALMEVVRSLPRHPLFRKIRAVEPELLLPYVVERLGATQRLALQMIEPTIAEGQREGSIRDGDVAAIASTLLLVVQSFVLSSSTVRATLPRERMLAELERVLDGALAPSAVPQETMHRGR